MRIAFYAPMKPPTHPSPSGDRETARLLMRALRRGGACVELASRLRAYDGDGDPARQRRIRAAAARAAGRIAAKLDSPDRRPDLWLTYHLYHKAPDWIGPEIADRLGVPYAVAEASVAGKRRDGAWAEGHAQSLRALARTRLAIGFNPADADGVAPHLPARARYVDLPPIVDAAPFRRAVRHRAAHRARLAAELGLDSHAPWIAVSAMMRPGVKLRSYRRLAEALARLPSSADWRLLAAGDGVARQAVLSALSLHGDRIRLLGRLDKPAMAAMLAACDLYAWPGIGEAFGVAYLEAQAAGLPVVAESRDGVPASVAPGKGGLLAAKDDINEFATMMNKLLNHSTYRQALGKRAAGRVAAIHDIGAAAVRLQEIVQPFASAYGAEPWR